ncbi:DUF2509 family protein [Vagococcus sp. WN89Y]|uniref:DUF2509 family protein n=1 Tax=Vagococcus sp. WN89Y TaxID=3457258 RepID=UPI003FCDE0F9
MSRQQGISSLAMVLLLLVLGSLLLSGLNQQLNSHIWRVNQESQAIQRMAEIHSAMAWGLHRSWLPSPDRQCAQHEVQKWRVCLRIFANGSVVLIVGINKAQLWRLGRTAGEKIRFSPHGWSDFCPLKEPALCQFP